MRKHHLISLVILFLTFAYSIIRYNFFGTTPWYDVSLFISNKALALSSVICISLSYIVGPLKKLLPKLNEDLLKDRKYFGLVGYGLAAIHTLISLLLFSPAYYNRFFEDSGRLTAIGSFSMMFGVLAFVVFTLVSLSSLNEIQVSLGEKSWVKIQKLGLIGFLLVLLHVGSMGYRGWIEPSRWPGGLVPISFLAAMSIVLTLIVRTLARAKKN